MADVRLVWSPSAEADLVDIWNWGATRFSAQIADGHVRDIAKAAAALKDVPLMGRGRGELKAGLRSVVIYPSVLFYRVVGTAVEIIRVVDGRRNIAALFSAIE